MTTMTPGQARAVHRALASLLTRANDNVAPANLSAHVCVEGGTAVPPLPATTRQDTLLVTLDADGRLDITVGVATHWTILWHQNFRFARTPGGTLALLGEHRDRCIHFILEDGRLVCDPGWPLLSAAQAGEATAVFDAEFAALVGKAN